MKTGAVAVEVGRIVPGKLDSKETLKNLTEIAPEEGYGSKENAETKNLLQNANDTKNFVLDANDSTSSQTIDDKTVNNDKKVKLLHLQYSESSKLKHFRHPTRLKWYAINARRFNTKTPMIWSL